MKVRTLIDTGASISFCRETIARIIGLEIKPNEFLPLAFAANGSEIVFIGRATATITIGNFVYACSILIAPDKECPAPLLVGTDILEIMSEKGFLFGIDFSNKRISIGGITQPLVSSIVSHERWRSIGKVKHVEPEFQSLRSDKTVVLMPLTDNIVKCYCKIFPAPNSIFLTAEKEKLKSDTNFIGGRSLIQPNFSNGIYIRILNLTNSKITIHEHEVIAKMKKIDFPKSVHTVKMGNRAEQSNSKREKVLSQ